MTIDRMKQNIKDLKEQYFPYFIKAMVSMETGENDEEKLDAVYDAFMESDRNMWPLLAEEFYARLGCLDKKEARDEA